MVDNPLFGNIVSFGALLLLENVILRSLSYEECRVLAVDSLWFLNATVVLSGILM